MYETSTRNCKESSLGSIVVKGGKRGIAILVNVLLVWLSGFGNFYLVVLLNVDCVLGAFTSSEPAVLCEPFIFKAGLHSKFLLRGTSVSMLQAKDYGGCFGDLLPEGVMGEGAWTGHKKTWSLVQASGLWAG